MPVKVRCKSCEKVLNAPDKYRGKAIKCPQCKSVVRIPATAKAKKPKAAAGEQADLGQTGFLDGLNLGDAVDRSVRVCPKCGTEVDAEEIDCPTCHVEVDTGVIRAKTLAKLRRRGPNPAEFYPGALTDARMFMRDHRSLVVRTFFTWLVFSFLSFLCMFAALRVVGRPPRMFLASLAVVLIAVPPGWTWFLHTEIIRGAIDKVPLLKRVRSDAFLNAYLGVKLVAWLVLFSIPAVLVTGLIGGLFLLSGMKMVAYILLGLGVVISLSFFPIAMVHMSMPVTIRGWIMPRLLPVYCRTFKPVFYWCFWTALFMIPTMAGLGVIGAVSANDIGTMAVDLQHNSQVKEANAYEIAKNEEPPAWVTSFKDLPVRSIDYIRLILPAGVWLCTCGAFALAAVFCMRLNGRFAYYFGTDLDLITHVGETQYVPKKGKKSLLDEDDEKIEQTGKKVALALGVLSLLACVGIGVATQEPIKYLILGVFYFVMWMPLGGLWQMYLKAGEPGWSCLVPVYQLMVLARVAGKPAWWGLLLYVPVVQLVIWVLISLELAKRFDRGTDTAIGLIFLPPVFFCILGFGDAEYQEEPVAKRRLPQLDAQ
jgi:phage FluMu protein Com